MENERLRRAVEKLDDKISDAGVVSHPCDEGGWDKLHMESGDWQDIKNALKEVRAALKQGEGARENLTDAQSTNDLANAGVLMEPTKPLPDPPDGLEIVGTEKRLALDGESHLCDLSYCAAIHHGASLVPVWIVRLKGERKEVPRCCNHWTGTQCDCSCHKRKCDCRVGYQEVCDVCQKKPPTPSLREELERTLEDLLADRECDCKEIQSSILDALQVLFRWAIEREGGKG